MKLNKKHFLWLGILALVIGGYFVLDSLLFDGVRPRAIQKNGFQANFFAAPEAENRPTVVIIGGGQWGDYWGSEFAKKGYAGLSLPYYRREGLPALPEEIPLEYFEQAIDWLRTQAEVNPDQIIVMGASRNAELALVLASTAPKYIHGVIAYAPSSVAWSNTVMPFNSDTIKPSWTYQGEAIPYVPMEKLTGGSTSHISTLPYWEQGLSKPEAQGLGIIPVEQVQGPILLFSGKDDQVWPSVEMANRIEARLQAHNFRFPIKNIQYEQAGHQISGNPENTAATRTSQMMIDGKSYTFELGGTAEADQAAQVHAKKKVFEWLKSL